MSELAPMTLFDTPAPPPQPAVAPSVPSATATSSVAGAVQIKWGLALHPDGGVIIGENHLPDDFAERPEILWKCHNCASEWMHWRPVWNGPRRWRLLHRDETCPCYLRQCECRQSGKEDNTHE